MSSVFKYLIVLVTVIVVVSLLVFTLSANSDKAKVGYVVTQRLYSDFLGTKELEKKSSWTKQKQKEILDSLNLEVKLLESSGKTSVDQLNLKKQNFNRLLTEFSESNLEQDQQYADAIWKQINQYMNDFGKEKKYAFIYGANGAGNLMFADSTYDITPQVVNYINEKYAGK